MDMLPKVVENLLELLKLQGQMFYNYKMQGNGLYTTISLRFTTGEYTGQEVRQNTKQVHRDQVRMTQFNNSHLKQSSCDNDSQYNTMFYNETENNRKLAGTQTSTPLSEADWSEAKPFIPKQVSVTSEGPYQNTHENVGVHTICMEPASIQNDKQTSGEDLNTQTTNNVMKCLDEKQTEPKLKLQCPSTKRNNSRYKSQTVNRSSNTDSILSNDSCSQTNITQTESKAVSARIRKRNISTNTDKQTDITQTESKAVSARIHTQNIATNTDGTLIKATVVESKLSKEQFNRDDLKSRLEDSKRNTVIHDTFLAHQQRGDENIDVYIANLDDFFVIISHDMKESEIQGTLLKDPEAKWIDIAHEILLNSICVSEQKGLKWIHDHIFEFIKDGPDKLLSLPQAVDQNPQDT